MDLSEQANADVNAAFTAADVAYDATTARIAKLIWLDGYKAGMDAVQDLAVPAMQKISDGLS